MIISSEAIEAASVLIYSVDTAGLGQKQFTFGRAVAPMEEYDHSSAKCALTTQTVRAGSILS